VLGGLQVDDGKGQMKQGRGRHRGGAQPLHSVAGLRGGGGSRR
jgi:hypothetical protein